jgi:hydrogenase maturation factor
MSQANVYTTVSNAVWYTDKCEIVTGNTTVTYQVYATALGTATAVGNIYSAAPQVAASTRQQIYVGAGNELTITGTNFTARELGTASSAQAGVIGQG